MTNDKKLLDGAGRCVAFWYVPARCGSCTLGEARDCYGSRYSDIVRYRGKGKFCYIIKPDKAFCSPGDDSSPCTVIDDTDMRIFLRRLVTGGCGSMSRHSTTCLSLSLKLEIGKRYSNSAKGTLRIFLSLHTCRLRAQTLCGSRQKWGSGICRDTPMFPGAKK